MSSRNIVSRAAVGAALAALLSACGGTSGSGGTAVDTSNDIAILKISYFRALPEPRTKKLEATYRVVMSKSWQDRVGDSPKEPLARAAPGKTYLGYVSDAEMVRYVRKLKEFGIDDLVGANPDELKPEDFNRLSLNPQETSFTRVFTVGSDKGSKSYWYRQQQTSKELIEKFVKCEAFVVRVCENSIQVRTMTDPLPPRNK